MTDVPFDFRTIAPRGELGRFVRTLWHARGQIQYRRERIAPSGSAVAIFVLGDPLLQTTKNGAGTRLLGRTSFLIGPQDKPLINEPQGATFAVGVVCTPIGSRAVFGASPASIRGDVVQLADLWPHADDVRRELIALDDPNERLAFLEKRLSACLDLSIRGLPRVERAVAMLHADPSVPIASVADELGISHGHLDREFTRIVGMGPRALARILRLRALLADLDVRRDPNWVDLALGGGWSDQSHFSRDFKRYTGASPRDYIRAQRTLYPDAQLDDAAGFVPEDGP